MIQEAFRSKRDELYDEIMDKAVAVGLGMASPVRIDEINILQATYEAMRQAIDNLKVKPDLLLEICMQLPFRGCDSTGSNHQGRCEKHIHRRSKYCGKGNKRSSDGRVWEGTSGIWIRFQTKVMDQQNISKRFRRLDRHQSTEEVLSDTSYKKIRQNRKGDQIQKAIGEWKNRRRTGTKIYEKIAGEFLEKQGYRILEYNFRRRYAEIDIVAKDGEYLVFLCNFAKQEGFRSAEAVSVPKQMRLSELLLAIWWRTAAQR